MELTLANQKISIKAEFAGYNKMWGDYRPTHRLSISIDNQTPFSTLFYDAVIEDCRVKEWNREDFLTALECVLKDATAYIDYPDFDDFAFQIGYEDNLYEGRKAYRGCRKIKEKLNAQGVDDDMMYDMLNEIEEM